MLEILILKNYHKGIKNAQALEPYIAAADVVSLECARFLETEARREEGFRAEALRGTETEKVKERLRIKKNITDPYTQEARLLMAKHDKPIIYLERNSRESKAELDGRVKKYKCDTDTTEYLKGNFDEAIEACHTRLDALQEITEIRDKNMGSNVPSVIPICKSTYALEKKQGTLHYLVVVGADHTPERYIIENSDVRFKIERLEDRTGTLDNLLERFGNAAYTDSREEPIARYLIGWTYCFALPETIQDDPNVMPYLTTVTNNFGMNECETLSRSLRDAEEDAAKKELIRAHALGHGFELPNNRAELEEAYAEMCQKR